MTKEELIEALEMFIGALKEKRTCEDKADAEPIIEQLEQTPTQPIVEPINTQPLPQVQQQLPQQPQLPATGWDILRYNQQKITALEEELNRLKMAGNIGMPISQYPSNYMTPVTPVQQISVNPNNIGGSL
jgi:hypothetical protein